MFEEVILNEGLKKAKKSDIATNEDEYFGYKVDEAGWNRAFSDEVLSNHTRNYYFGVADSIESTIVNKIDNKFI